VENNNNDEQKHRPKSPNKYNVIYLLSVFWLYRELGIGIVAYSPLGRGFFDGRGGC
jgi:aryl-alcohol dehydrogenase-like predicted oxidoreductase